MVPEREHNWRCSRQRKTMIIAAAAAASKLLQQTQCIMQINRVHCVYRCNRWPLLWSNGTSHTMRQSLWQPRCRKTNATISKGYEHGRVKRIFILFPWHEQQDHRSVDIEAKENRFDRSIAGHKLAGQNLQSRHTLASKNSCVLPWVPQTSKR